MQKKTAKKKLIIKKNKNTAENKREKKERNIETGHPTTIDLRCARKERKKIETVPGLKKTG